MDIDVVWPDRTPAWMWALAAFVALLALYACSLDSDIGFWDTGEMNTVPYILGLAHPTGYPTEILVGWIFSHVFVAGSVAFRLTVLNAIEIAGAGALGCALIRAETGSAVTSAFSERCCGARAASYGSTRRIPTS